MKKLLCLLLVLAMVFSLSATLISCGDVEEEDNEESADNNGNGNDKPSGGGNDQHSCADVDADFKCDDPTCGAFICRGQHKDYDGNGACDGKGCTFSFAMAGHTTHIDEVADGKCDYCEAPVGGSTPSDPSDPSNPSNPQDPSDPSNPGNDPSDPSDPGNDPSNPSDPGTEPSDPSDPGNDPGENPGDNPGNEPSDPTVPVEPAPGEGAVESYDLAFSMNADGMGYSVVGIGQTKEKSFLIPEKYNGYPVVAVADGAFSGLSYLEYVGIPRNVTYIGAEAFYGCSSLRGIGLSDTVEVIGDSAFYNCFSLESLTLPEGLTTIGQDAFVECCLIESSSIYI